MTDDAGSGVGDSEEVVGGDDVEAASNGDDVEAASADDDDPAAVLDSLFATIEQRKRDLPEGSYTASLIAHESGQNEVLEKLGEEATEVLLAAKDGDDDELAAESADLVYHLLVLLAMHDLTVDDLRAELRSRF